MEKYASALMMVIELHKFLVNIHQDYPRAVGSMVMVSNETEDKIEGIVEEIAKNLAIFEEITDNDIIELVEQTPDEFRHWLEEEKNIIEAERIEIARARDFLARYYA